MNTLNKLDHFLIVLLEDLAAAGPSSAKSGRGAGPASMPSHHSPFFSSPEAWGRIVRDGTVRVVIETRSVADTLASLQRHGAELEAATKRHVVARIPFTAIRPIADEPEVLLLHADREAQLLLDHGNAVTQLTVGPDTIVRYYERILGDEVLVGVIDSGIDVTHPTFQDRHGNSRIVAYKLMETGKVYGISSICSDPISKAANDPQAADTNGHGTLVASVSAGNGLESPNGLLVGVAPTAKIAVVKYHNGLGDIVAGLEFLAGVADTLGLPLVVNISLGAQVEAHDGSSAVERAIDDFSGDGRVVVIAQGNDGRRASHAGGVVRQDQAWSARIEPDAAGNLSFATWTTARARDIELELVDPLGLVHTSALANPSVTFRLAGSYEGRWHVNLDPINGDLNFNLTLTIETSGPLFETLRQPWTIRTRRVHDLDREVTIHTWIPYTIGSFTHGSSRDYTVMVPATARSAIAVGSFVSRDSWTDASLSTHPIVDPVDSLSQFSSWGPTRDGRPRPALVAPGQLIEGARSSAMNPAPAPAMVINNHYRIAQGTSFAAPYVTGAVALLLQLSPTLDPDRSLALLQATATDVDPVPNHSWGAGRLDFRRLLGQAVREFPPTNADFESGCAEPEPFPTSALPPARRR